VAKKITRCQLYKARRLLTGNIPHLNPILVKLLQRQRIEHQYAKQAVFQAREL